jgi:hypothetical protein
MNKEIYKPLFFWTVVILQIILISLYANTFYQSGCKVKEFTQNIKTIILSPQKLSEKSISEYANTLILVLGLTSLSLTIAFRPENVVFRKKKRKMVNSSKKVTESSIFLHGIKPVGKVNQDIIPAKETIEDKEKEKNLSISKEKEEEELPDKETVEQEEKKERKETENSEQEKNLSQTSTHHKESGVCILFQKAGRTH